MKRYSRRSIFQVVFLVINVFFLESIAAQSFYDIKGNELTGTSLDVINSKLNRVHLSDNGDMVGFKKLSDKALWCYTKNPKNIPALIKSFNYSKYLSSFRFQWDMDSMIVWKLLDTSYALSVFGKPDQRKIDSKFEVFDEWTYRKFDMKISFNENLAIEWKAIPFSKMKLHSFLITKWEIGGSDYSTDLTIEISNLSSKTIKYVWFTTVAFNPVKDRIGTKTVQGIGPIAANESGSWNFDNVYYSRVLDVVRITGVKIQYMDGSIKLIPSTDIGKIIVKGED